MDPRLETCRRWMMYQARRVFADVFTPPPAPRERLLRRDRLIDSALWTAERPHSIEDRPAAG